MSPRDTPRSRIACCPGFGLVRSCWPVFPSWLQLFTSRPLRELEPRPGLVVMGTDWPHVSSAGSLWMDESRFPAHMSASALCPTLLAVPEGQVSRAEEPP